ncbi:MAG: Sir2 family NAD-dependent protein deacetylase [Microthrixaceae bacterium]
MTEPAVDVRSTVDAARRLVGASSRIVVLTGAGISTDSGIPDFRGPNGLWTRTPDAEKLSSIDHYLADPEIRRRAWLGRLDHPAWTSDPNDGHAAIVRLDDLGRLHLLITQNVDGLHHESGLDPDRIVEIHGSIREVECLSCGFRGPMQETLDRVRSGEADPPCLMCGDGILKSATISFGQGLVAADLDRAFDAARRCDLLVAVGTNLSVFPIANVVPLAARAGAPVVIVNGSPTEMDELATVVVRGSISEVLPRIVG